MFVGILIGIVFELSGEVIDLVIDELLVNFIGVVRMVIIINGLILVFILCFREGDDVIIRVMNKLLVLSLIYWYGIIFLY